MAPFRSLPLSLAILALSAVLSLSRAEDFYSGTDVVELTAANFKSKVIDDDHVWMIEFYAPWCGHCQRLKPDYIKAATASKGIVRFGAINCDEHRSIASEYNIKGFPTLKLFGPNKKRYEDYHGARTPKAMADAALALLPNLVTVVSQKGHAEFLEKNAGLPKALLFTAKASTTALYKALALDLKGRMALGEVRAKKDKELLTKYNVEESALPVLLVLPLEVEGEEGAATPPKYEGELKHKPLLKFLSQYAKPKPGKEGKEDKGGKDGKESTKASESSKAKAEAAPKKPAVAQLESSADVESKCLKGKGHCVIALLPSADSKEQVESLEGLASMYQKDPLKFSWLDASSSSSAGALEALFVSPEDKAEHAGQPALVLLSPKRGKFTVHWGLEGLEALLDRAIGGDVSLESRVEEDWHKALDSA